MGQSLTERQAQCLKLSSNMTDKEIARELNLSPHTVNLHIRNAMKKLGTSNRRAALRSIADYSYSGENGIEINREAFTSLGVSSASVATSEASLASWIYAPALLPAPPKRRSTRLWMMIATSLAIVVIGASVLGLLGLVLDVVDRWAAAATTS